jgi:hypothetical protein
MTWELIGLIIDEHVEEIIVEYREELEYAIQFNIPLKFLDY